MAPPLKVVGEASERLGAHKVMGLMSVPTEGMHIRGAAGSRG